tara:strand:- start:1402 stop:1812 length:411 start_codon:yes stop_codon:yes gene_type:complete
MREEKLDKPKKGKGVSVVIAVTKPSPKSPTDTATPDAMKKAFQFLKDYNQMGVGAGAAQGMNLQAMRQRVHEMDARAQQMMASDPQGAAKLRAEADYLANQIEEMMGARRNSKPDFSSMMSPEGANDIPFRMPEDV